MSWSEKILIAVETIIEKITKYKKNGDFKQWDFEEGREAFNYFCIFFLTNQNTVLNKKILKKNFNDEVSNNDVMREDIDDVKKHNNDIVKKNDDVDDKKIQKSTIKFVID